MERSADDPEVPFVEAVQVLGVAEIGHAEGLKRGFGPHRGEEVEEGPRQGRRVRRRLEPLRYGCIFFGDSQYGLRKKHGVKTGMLEAKTPAQAMGDVMMAPELGPLEDAAAPCGTIEGSSMGVRVGRVFRELL